MKGKTRLLSTFLFRTGLLDILKRRRCDQLVVLNYHRVRPDDGDVYTPFDDKVYGPTVSQLDEQMGWLKRHTRILSEAEVIACLNRRSGPGESSVLITTDDGYRDNYTRVFPVLKCHDIPAIFFVPTRFIEERRLGWWDRLAYVLKKNTKPQITYEGRTLDLAQRDQVFAILKRFIVDGLVTAPHELPEHIAALCEVDPPSAEEQDGELMTWEQLRELREHEIVIGSHTHSHPILSRIDASLQRAELAESKQVISMKTGATVRSLAYPTGARDHFTTATQRIGRELGYDLGFSFYSGFNRWPTMDAFDVRRVEVSYQDRIGVAATAILPQLFTWPK